MKLTSPVPISCFQFPNSFHCICIWQAAQGNEEKKVKVQTEECEEKEEKDMKDLLRYHMVKKSDVFGGIVSI